MKRFQKLYLLIIFVLSSVCQGFSQPQEGQDYLNPWQLISLGKNAQRAGDIYTAIKYFRQHQDKDPNNLEVAYRVAELYEKARDYENAAFYYLKTYHLNVDDYTKSLFLYAQMEKNMGNYDRAIAYYNRFKSEYRGKKKERPYRRRVINEVEGCEMAKEWMDAPLKVMITRLGNSVNKAHIEFNPIILDDHNLVFASLREDSLKYYSLTDSSKLPKRKFYMARKKGREWYFNGEFPGPFNTENAHTGNGAFSPDGQRFYFTRCEKNWLNETVCHLYMARKRPGGWQPPVKLNKKINMPLYHSTQPTVGTMDRKSKEVVYYVSNRPDGKGGWDIWYTIYDKKDNDFYKPRNVGRKINSSDDEMSPFYDNTTGTMYFSSTGHIGMGGYDIFKTSGKLSRWVPNEHLGYPVNTSYDDLYYTLNKNHEEGFFVSNRPGGSVLMHETCCDDIYYFKYMEFIHIDVEGKLVTDKSSSLQKYIDQADLSLRGQTDSKYAVEGAVITLYLDNPGEDNDILIAQDTTDAGGNYSFDLEHNKNYKMILNDGGVFSKEYEFNTRNIRNSKTIEIEETPVIVMPDQPLVIKNIYYPFDKATLTEDAKATIDTTLLTLLQDMPNIIVEISSHTDSVGNPQYNLKLSQKRAESVVRYLVNKGIEEERMVARGYGDQKPLAPNTFPDGTDNPEGREKNRRTEFIIIGTIVEED